jgi:hypothetical protein
MNYATRRPWSCSSACHDGVEVGSTKPSANTKNLLLAVGGAAAIAQTGIRGGQ